MASYTNQQKQWNRGIKHIRPIKIDIERGHHFFTFYFEMNYLLLTNYCFLKLFFAHLFEGWLFSVSVFFEC